MRSKGGGAARMAPDAKVEGEKTGPDLWAVTYQRAGHNPLAIPDAAPKREHQPAPELGGARCKMSSCWSDKLP
jgi:hypothetical protein